VAEDYVNYAEITASDQSDPNSSVNEDASVDDFSDGIADDDEDSFTIKVGVSDLSLVKSVSNEDANVGDTITFTLQINNAGPDAATGVSLEDIIPIGYSNISNISAGGILDVDTIIWSDLDIPLTGLTITYDVVVNMPIDEEGEYLNIAQITGSNQFDPNSEPNNH